MVISSDFFTRFEKQETQAHGYKAQHEHRWQPDCEIHSETPFAVVAVTAFIHSLFMGQQYRAINQRAN
jgi:hypothetical protein